ncbi:MAG: FMN-binding protein [Elusimicrobia bacterium]|nr:FMN-binding protein [Elusimicrobiota bacterium]
MKNLKRILGPVLLVTLLTAWIYNFHLHTVKKKSIQDDFSIKPSILQKVFPSFPSADIPVLNAKKTLENKNYYEIYSKGSHAGYCFFTTDLVPDEGVGYGGEMKILVGVDLGGKITGIEVIQHSETSGYVSDSSLEKFTGRFTGKTKNDKLEAGQDIDGITGATLTTNAIANAVRKGLVVLAEQTGGFSDASGGPPARFATHFAPHTGTMTTEFATTTATRFSPRPVINLLLLAAFLCLAFYGFFVRGDKHYGRVRNAVIISGIIIPGFYLNIPFSIINVLNVMTQRFTGFSFETMHYWVFWAVIFITLLLLGRFYCGWLCPFGFLEEILNLRDTAGHSGAGKNMVDIKYLLLWIAMVVSLVHNNPNLANYEPFSVVFGFVGGPPVILIALAALVMSVFFSRYFCRYFCPVGALLGICSRVSLWKLKVTGSCTRCEKCVKICPVGAVGGIEKAPPETKTQPAKQQVIAHVVAEQSTDPSVKSAEQSAGTSSKIYIKTIECIQCNKCINACPAGAIRRKTWIKL